MDYRVLGLLEVRDGEGLIELGGAKQRALLALLLLNANRVVPRERLIDELWSDDPPVTAITTVQVYVSRLRKVLPPETLVTRSPGYRLEVAPEELDLFRFERLVAEARGADAERASRLLREALELWRGPALAELGESFARAEAGRLEDLRLAALEERIEADLALDRHAELVGELASLIAEHPHRERLRSELMLALYRSGRQAEALAAYRDARDALDELGIEPSKALRQFERQILRQDVALAPAQRKSNLPLEQTPLVGRRRELEEVLELVRARAVVTLTGAGGSGKTRLAVAAARELLDEFADGVWFVSLGSLTDPALVEPTIAQALGARGDLNDFLRRKQLLLLLDNLEQLLPEIAPTVARLETTVLATSRERLNVTGEHEYPVPTLPLGDAVALFTQRARQLQPRFESDGNVAEIARRLDGLPLALELAAARVKALTPAQIVERLGRSLDVLTGGARDAPERQQTLRTTIEWSYQLLNEHEQTLFARLAVFVGGCTLAAAEQIADAELDVIQSLVDKNLLRHSEARFWMLETIRALALEKLELRDDAEQLRRRHAQYLIQFLRTLEMSGPDAARRVREHAESDNLRAALEWALHRRHADLALSLAVRNARFTAPERARWLDASLLLADRADPTIRADALAQAAFSHLILGDFDRVETLAQRSLDEFVALGDRTGQSKALQEMAFVAEARGENDRARELLEESIELAEATGTTHRWSLHNLGELELLTGNLERAASFYKEALQLALDAADTQQVAQNEHGLGNTALAAGDTAGAERYYLHALSLARELDARRVIAQCLAGLASLAAKRGQRERAGRLWGASEAFQRASGIELLAAERRLYEDALTAVAGPQFEHAADATRSAEPDEALAAALAD